VSKVRIAASGSAHSRRRQVPRRSQLCCRAARGRPREVLHLLAKVVSGEEELGGAVSGDLGKGRVAGGAATRPPRDSAALSSALLAAVIERLLKAERLYLLGHRGQDLRM